MSRESIRALVDAATPGPWEADAADPGDVVVWSGDDPRWVANVGNWARQNPEAADASRWRQAVEASAADAAFIAAARTVVPLLLAVADAAAEVATMDLRGDFPDGGDIVLRWAGNREDWGRLRAALVALDADTL